MNLNLFCEVAQTSILFTLDFDAAIFFFFQKSIKLPPDTAVKHKR